MLQEYKNLEDKRLKNDIEINKYIEMVQYKKKTPTDLYALFMTMQAKPVSSDVLEKAHHMICIENKIKELQKTSTPLDLQQLQ